MQNPGMSNPLRVLVVDDHDAFRASAGRLLAAEGYDVVGEAADGEQAIAAARELSPDVVLLDVQMPGLDGFAVAGRLLQQGAPMIVLTSSRDRADYGPLIEESGARGFIAKSELSGAALAEVLR